MNRVKIVAALGVGLAIAAVLITLAELGLHRGAGPAAALQSLSQALKMPEVEPIALPPGPPPILLGIQPFTNDFKIDSRLRLEVPNDTAVLQLRADVSGKRDRHRTYGNLEYWALGNPEVAKVAPIRQGEQFDLISAFLRYSAPVDGFELWHDPTCEAWYLLASFEMPSEDEASEETLWIGTVRPFPLRNVGLEESLEVHQPPDLPPEVSNLFPAIQSRMLTAAAASETASANPGEPGVAGPGETGVSGGATGEPPPGFSMTVTLGNLSPTGGPGILALGTWMRTNGLGSDRMLLLLTPKGREILHLDPAALSDYSAELPSVAFMVDVDGDGRDEAVMSSLTLNGAEKTLIWSFAGNKLTKLAQGTWWGCSAGMPTVPEDEVLSGTEAVMPDLPQAPSNSAPIATGVKPESVPAN